MKKSFLCLFLIFCFAAAGTGFAQDVVSETVKPLGGEYPLISESDLYCSIFMWNGPLPSAKIIGAEKQEEKTFFSDAELVTIDKGSADGLEIGQLFLVVNFDRKIEGFGLLMRRVGRAQIMKLEEKRSVARIEKSCNQIAIGSFLVPFEEKEGLSGRDEGYVYSVNENPEIKASVIYIDTELRIAGTGNWIILDAGKSKGLQVGRQLTVMRKGVKGNIDDAIGNVIVIDVQNETATAKVLSCRDGIEIGYEVRTK